MTPISGLRAALAGGRLAAGVLALGAPATVARAVGTTPADNPDGDYLLRLFGSRELVVGAIAAGALGPGTATRAFLLGAGVDALDAAAVLRAGRDGRFAPHRARAIASGCLAIAALGVVAAAVPRG
ncbi:hypothetical protein [Paraconexibacter algicola]|uniref:DUF4267 domain-containing protein n=1 Tax=Paraconexibacter algicola TaxID=2133960 RepID=A0A2T4UK73_9ACTN|nr:hypothetical protein [Paraconexibacter algicola]PTL59615.1 hypothetical protein C7Y72_08115 [Paraconexibacter algicola]